jgi:uncharacterized membrane protein
VDQRELVQPPAVQMNTRRIVAVGTALFLVAFLALLPFWTWLGEHHHRSWLWTALSGAVLGVIGWSIMLNHKRLGRTI